jgi:prepilin-type N-terminal cleavage/methylation domain-containing protein
MDRSHGFSLVEMIVALAVLLAVTGAVLRLVLPSEGTFASRTETADMQQRLRVASDTLFHSLVAAGVGAYAGPSAGRLSDTLAPVLPYRTGGVVRDPPGTYKSDTITVFSVSRDAANPVSSTYWLKTDAAAATFQLMRNESTNNADVPVVDDLVGLVFDYYGDPQPPRVNQPADGTGPWTTSYGPAPPTIATPSFAAGENCVFVKDPSTAPQPRLMDLGDPASSLVKLTASQLSDGPWCPNATDASRWDADLLRIRAVMVTVRVQAAPSMLRGPASVLFAHGGTSRSAASWVPDQELRFQVAPRNLNFGR